MKKQNYLKFSVPNDCFFENCYTVKLGNKEWFDKEQIGIKEPFPVTNEPFTS
jgi:hypothetical protein